MPRGLLFGPLGGSCTHLCVDMQRLFAKGTDWATPWMERVLPRVVELTAAHPDRVVFTRFVPPRSAAECKGCWNRYWERWSSMTLESMGADAVELLPELAGFAPPAPVIDKRVYSPWTEPMLNRELQRLGTETVIVTGGETEVCVLGSVLGAIDGGYRVVVASDGLCSSSDETHDALLQVYTDRYSQHVEVATVREILEAWR